MLDYFLCSREYTLAYEFLRLTQALPMNLHTYSFIAIWNFYYYRLGFKLCIFFYNWLLIFLYSFILSMILEKMMTPHLKEGPFQSSYIPHSPLLQPDGSIRGRRKTGRTEWRRGPGLMETRKDSQTILSKELLFNWANKGWGLDALSGRLFLPRAFETIALSLSWAFFPWPCLVYIRGLHFVSSS